MIAVMYKLLDLNKQRTHKSKITECAANVTWLDVICAYLWEVGAKFLCMLTVNQPPFAPRNILYEDDVCPPDVIDSPLLGMALL